MTVVECDTMPPHTHLKELGKKKERNIQTNKNAKKKVGLWAENRPGNSHKWFKCTPQQ
jgi:hypothetical protein